SSRLCLAHPSYRAPSGRMTTQWHVPDFFVLRRNGAGFEEWTSASALAARTRRMPGRYQEEQGVRRCPSRRSLRNTAGPHLPDPLVCSRENPPAASGKEPAFGTPSKQPRGGRRGEHAPRPDPVGEVLLEASASRCTFAGAIDISAAQMAEAGIAKVECPECATVRTLQPHGTTVRFPSHLKRKTQTRSIEARWIRKGDVWALATV